MGIVDDEYGGYENLAAFTDARGNVDFMGAYYSAAGLGGDPGYLSDDVDSTPLLTPGASVTLGGLARAAHHNRRVGSLVAWHAGRGRWEVDLGDHGADHLLVLPHNLQVMGPLPGGYNDGGVLLSLEGWMPEVWEGLQASLERSGVPLFTLQGTTFSALTRNLSRFKCAVIVGIGSSGDRGSMGDLLSNVPLREALTSWVRDGGHLIVHGEGFVTEVFRWFDKPWDWEGDMYRRTSHAAGENAPNVLGFLPAGYNVKACMISRVPPSERILSAPPDAVSHSHVPMMAGVPVDEDKCAVASGSYGRGRIAFFGDVNAEECTLAVVAGMVRESCQADLPGMQTVD